MSFDEALKRFAQTDPRELKGNVKAKAKNLSEMTAALEMPVAILRRGERECPVDHGAQAMQCISSDLT